MSRVKLLVNQLAFTFNEEGWYPPLEEALTGLTAAQASWRPTGEAANSIWETVNHLIFYKERWLERMKGNEPTSEINDNTDTFTQGETTDEKAWQETVEKLRAIQKEWHEIISTTKEEDLDQKFSTTPLWMQFSNLILHDAYHTGQIISIRKLQGSWPSRRSYT
ncbi:DinB family protein [Thermoflavimicrobium dichotomicum]|uniref:DinB superfamily protein n=1 Tax=Thermoflavimicrobium dichotomicum TaxID=46223 RepID=A0A1I3V0Y8_9BACL|nr:DinB family protein [Thermoflavimicrobium dichotomicum]SFJ88820.1 DinB superfamily protein [Thermoflavimicrobium dichotomicum]